MRVRQPLSRRTILEAAGLTAIASVVAPGGASGGQRGEVEQANVAIVNRFCDAWSTRDLTKILPFLADDCVYRMTETTPPVTGHAGVTERLGSWTKTSDRIEFNVLDTFAKGPMVINHRIDRFISTTRPLTWEGVGVFFVKDGRIQEWFDYTISVDRGAPAPAR